MEEQTTIQETFNTEKLKTNFRYFPFFNKRQPVFILVLLGAIFYSTSLYNEYTLDDGIIIHQNEFVIKGVKGIPDILTSDVYGSFYKRMCATDQLTGGRYRPLSVISFAIEQQFIQPYRTGFYMKAEDSDHNGVLDKEKTTYTTPCGKPETNYEYNEFIDLNNDGIAQPNECNACWDLNQNFHNDADEDLNADGVFNEVDCQVYGAYVRHFNNIWTYILCCVLLYVLFRNYMFRNNHDLAFVAALLFLMHPVHTEVVANVRGRDDIFSLIFICLTFLFSFKFIETKKWMALLAACVMFLLALLSKEYGLVLLVLVPLGIYVFSEAEADWKKLTLPLLVFLALTFLMIVLNSNAFSFQFPAMILMGIAIFVYALVVLVGYRSFKERKVMALMSGFFVTALFYLGLRLNAVTMMPGLPDTEILNNPYLLANGSEKFATKMFVMLKYLGVSLFPNNLVCDYSFNEIVYRKLTDWDFIFSSLLNAGLMVLGIRLVFKRHVLGFAIISYFAFLIVPANFIFETGCVMLEANLFHSTVGVAIVLGWLALNGADKIKAVSFNTKRVVLLSLLIVICVLCGIKTSERNKDWKNDVTLFLKDVKKAPNSVLVLGNAGARWIDLADTHEITGINIPGTDSTRFNDYNGTLRITDEEVKQGGYASKREAALYKGITYLKRAVDLHPRYVNGYLNLGLAYFKLKKDKETIIYWKLAERLYPNNPYLRNYYIVFYNFLKKNGSEAFEKGDYAKALIEYNKCTLVDPNNAEGWYNLGGAYFHLNNLAKAQTCWEKALKIKPDYEEVKKALSFPGMSVKNANTNSKH